MKKDTTWERLAGIIKLSMHRQKKTVAEVARATKLEYQSVYQWLILERYKPSVDVALSLAAWACNEKKARNEIFNLLTK